MADAKRIAMTSEQKQTQKTLYESILGSGIPDRQARQLTAEFGRENDYDPKAIFGIHWDSNRWNIGAMSWTTDRAGKLIDRFKEAKLISKDEAVSLHNKFAKVGAEPPKEKGESRQRIMTDEPAALKTQMGYVKEEIEHGLLTHRSRDEWLHAQNVSNEKAAEILGKHYIGWDYAGHNIGKAGAERAKQKVRDYSKALDERLEYDPPFHRQYGAAGIKSLIDKPKEPAEIKSNTTINSKTESIRKAGLKSGESASSIQEHHHHYQTTATTHAGPESVRSAIPQQYATLYHAPKSNPKTWVDN